jgi:uncharacterized protein (TIRG00374 family)
LLHSKAVSSIFILSILFLLLKTWRWSFLLRQFGIKLSRTTLLKSVASGFYLGLVTPGTSGEFARVINTPIGKSLGISIIILEKAADFILLFYFSSIGILFLCFPELDVKWSILFPLPFLGLFLIILWRIKPFFRFIKKKLLKKLNFSEDRFNNITEVLRGRNVIAVCVIVSALLWIIPGIQFYLICHAVQIDMHYKELVVSFYGPYLIGIVSMIPLGIGIFDIGTSNILSRLFHYSKELSNMSMLLFRILVTLPLVIFGFICFAFTMSRK